ncbi:hypothetical protein [Streptomyces sp. NPDC047079]|uniref:hypothetical protein n=1 Tax=Streptomyces sp. NPDC047079 TaxID=3154607 RepID=UPI0033DF05D7
MRLSRPSRLSLFLPCALAAVLLLRQAPAAALVADARPGCSSEAADAFPLTTRIHGGPGSYKPGDADDTWFIDIQNTTDRSCKNVHPAVVLVDSRRKLRDAEPKLDFYGGDRWHPVTFTHTDREELVGAFDDGFPGFTVAPHRTLTVKVRFSLTARAQPNDVRAKAAILRKIDNAGDWVGESDDYWFQIDSGGAPAAEHTGKAAERPGKATEKPDKAASPSGKAASPSGKASEPGKDASPSGKAAEKPGKAAEEPDKAAAPGEDAEQSDKGHSPALNGTAAKSPSSRPAPTAEALAVATPQPSRDLVKFVGGLAMAAVGLLVAGGSLVMARRRH